MKSFTFEQIPLMMSKLHDKLEHIESLIKKISVAGNNRDDVLNIEETSKLLNLSISTIL